MASLPPALNAAAVVLLLHRALRYGCGDPDAPPPAPTRRIQAAGGGGAGLLRLCGCARPDPAARAVRTGLLQRSGFDPADPFDDDSADDGPGTNSSMDAAFRTVERLERGGR